MANFSERAGRARPNHVDDARALLIQAGQFEQGMADAGHDASRLTDSAAEAFYRILKDQPADLRQLREVEEGPDLTLTIKIPEGYEFYALYPEQYIATAEEIAKERPDQRALVVGIRSIGTSLSAVVSTVLKNSQRCTVRPEGHPFDRKVTLPQVDTNNFDFAVIVDEGPGLSGSSAAAAWRALREAGFSDILLLPGHETGPGPAANEAARAIWAQAEKRFTPPEPLPGRDLTAGRWRELLDGDWPAAFVPLERPKYLTADGVLWKFAGLGAAYESGRTAIELARERMEAIAAEGFGPAPLESAKGFIAMPWIEGIRLTKADARDPAVLDLISRYVIRFAGLPLDPDEMRAGQDRLAEMAIVNTREALGDKWAKVAKHKLDPGHDVKMFQSYGDGRLAPHEWVRDRDGCIFKVDSFGHDADHTLVGKQSLVWDVAGLTLEWELNEAKTGELLATFTRQGACLTSEVLAFYQLAYSAFRMGLCNVCGVQAHDEREKSLLAQAEKAWCHKLLYLLNRE